MAVTAVPKPDEFEISSTSAPQSPSIDDPLLSVEQWYPEFHRFHMAVVAETPEFDYGWLRHNRPELYRAIKAKEDEIDALGATRLSQVMALLREWRELILTACFNQRTEARERR
jgi:hypothetical protein